MNNYIISEAFEQLSQKNKLKTLNEGSNKNRLTETFNASMPEWIQQYYLNSDNRNYKNWLMNGKSKFNSRDRDVGRSRKDAAYYELGHLGFDPHEAEFIVTDVPESLKDPIFSNPDIISFVHLKSDNDETLWMPGYSAETEKFILDDGKRIALNKMSNAQFKQYAKDFAYIENNTSNLGRNIKHNDRLQNRDGMIREVPWTRYERGKDHDPWDVKYVYKLVDKRVDDLIELRRTKIPQLLDQIGDRLENVNLEDYPEVRDQVNQHLRAAYLEISRNGRNINNSSRVKENNLKIITNLLRQVLRWLDNVE